MEKLDLDLLMKIADLHGIPEGSYNIRKDGKCLSRNSTSDIEIVPKKDKDGIDIIVKPGVKNKSVHIPVILTAGEMLDKVYNDFYIGKGADVLMKIDRIGRRMWMGQGMCGSSSGSVPTNVGQPRIRVSEITVGGKGGAL